MIVYKDKGIGGQDELDQVAKVNYSRYQQTLQVQEPLTRCCSLLMGDVRIKQGDM